MLRFHWLGLGFAVVAGCPSLKPSERSGCKGPCQISLLWTSAALSAKAVRTFWVGCCCGGIFYSRRGRKKKKI
ncbi:hypothetical protein F4811DRAFT_517603, partial [Daldinia bambusicola]